MFNTQKDIVVWFGPNVTTQAEKDGFVFLSEWGTSPEGIGGVQRSYYVQRMRHVFYPWHVVNHIEQVVEWSDDGSNISGTVSVPEVSEADANGRDASTVLGGIGSDTDARGIAPVLTSAVYQTRFGESLPG